MSDSLRRAIGANQQDSQSIADSSAWGQRLGRLELLVRGLERVIVAFSGGVDSAVVAAASARWLGSERCRLVMAVGPAVPKSEVDDAMAYAAELGLPLIQVDAQEWLDPNYLRNDAQRCYYCKSHLYQTLTAYRASLCDGHAWQLINGVNADDLGDYRPGLQAAREAAVISPLAEAGFTKADVRLLADSWHMTVHDKPATPCLASRIAYGEAVSVERLSRVEQAEQWLRQQGLRELRVRYHAQEMARIEVPATQIACLTDETMRRGLVEKFKQLGFRYITLDLEGFRSGSLNESLGEIDQNSQLQKPLLQIAPLARK